MILKLFSPKNLAKISAVFAQTTAILCKNLIIHWFVRKTPILAENCQKSQKIVITTLAPNWAKIRQ
jgi:hypothetical protein